MHNQRQKLELVGPAGLHQPQHFRCLAQPETLQHFKLYQGFLFRSVSVAERDRSLVVLPEHATLSARRVGL